MKSKKRGSGLKLVAPDHSPLFLSGIAGSGKTTCARWLQDQLKFGYFSTGNYVRNKVLAGDNACTKALAQGILAPVEYELRGEILKLPPNTIVDGFPRSRSQYDWILRHFATPTIIVIGISRWEAESRLHTRKREKEEIISKRIQNEFLGFIGEEFVVTVNGEQPIEKVCEEVLRWTKLLI